MRRLGKLGVAAIGITVVAMIVINAGFLFNRAFTPLGDYRFRSVLFQSLQSRLAAQAAVPVPLAYPYVEGLDWMRATERTSDRYGNVYLLGHLSKPQGFSGYYFIASALKLPLATQLLLVTAAVAYLASPDRRARFARDEVFLVVPAVILALYFNFFFNAQTGMRYYMVLFPCLYIFAGSQFRSWASLGRSKKAGAVLLLILLAVSVISYFPHFTPYFNELLPDKTQTYKYLADTNLEWGQSQAALQQYLTENPAAVYSPMGPQPGHLVVGGSDLVGILEPPDRYAWLRDNFEPTGTVAYSYFVYHISPQEIAELCSRQDVCD